MLPQHGPPPPYDTGQPQPGTSAGSLSPANNNGRLIHETIKHHNFDSKFNNIYCGKTIPQKKKRIPVVYLYSHIPQSLP